MLFALIDKARSLMQEPDFTDQAKRGAVAVVGAATSAWTLNNWVTLATGIYIVVQAAYLLRKWWREEKEHASRKDAP